MSTVEYSFGSWIKRHRKALDLTQQDLAQRVGCSPSLIFKIESDEPRPGSAGSQDGHHEQALERVIHVLQHEASPQEVKQRAGQARAELQARLTPQQIEAAQAQAQDKSLKEVVEETLGL